MKQGRASIKGPYDRKIEPKSRFVNPGAVSYLGEKLGNHSTDGGDFVPNLTRWDGGRGYTAPSIGSKKHKTGSQGKY